jgi:hypothetical protein
LFQEAPNFIGLHGLNQATADFFDVFEAFEIRGIMPSHFQEA